MPAYKSELTTVANADDMSVITRILSDIGFSEYGDSPAKASLAVAYERKGNETISDVNADNSYRRNAAEETFILTLEVRVNKYDINYELLEPFIKKTVTDLKKEEQAKAVAQREALIAHRTALEVEISKLDSQLAE